MALRLETPRLVLRVFEPRDAAPFSEYRSDPEVARYQGWQAPFSLESAVRYVAELQRVVPGTPGQHCQLALERKSGGEMIGDFVFQVLPQDARQAEIGYTLARAYQGQGYASEALARLLVYLFRDLDLHRVHADIDPRNLPSARLLKRAGFRHEGRFVESLWFKGGWADEDWYALLKSEWMQREQR